MALKKRIFSGIQPSGNLHIGNYLGAIKNWIALQYDFESIFCVVDLHAITVPQDPKKLKSKTLEIAKIYLALGIDLSVSKIFVQSHIKEHTELMWLLNTIARMSELRKMTQFKDKTQKEGEENSSVGLFNYPVLMAADILLYDTQVVPVGEDQLQHIELTRNLAERFNHQFGETFVIPEAFIKKEGMRIMGLDDPTKKMSKSALSKYNAIGLNDSADQIREKIKKAVTDSGNQIVYADEKPALKNLLNIYSSFSNKSIERLVSDYSDKSYKIFKEDLAEVIIEFLIPFQEKFNALSDEETLKILLSGAEAVRPIAERKLHQVKEKMGFVL